MDYEELEETTRRIWEQWFKGGEFRLTKGLRLAIAAEALNPHNGDKFRKSLNDASEALEKLEKFL